MSDEIPSVPPVTVAKRYRKQTSQTGSDDFVCVAEQSGLEEVQASPALDPAVASSDVPSVRLSSGCHSCTCVFTFADVGWRWGTYIGGW